jgi:HK97 family phage portal protein
MIAANTTTNAAATNRILWLPEDGEERMWDDDPSRGQRVLRINSENAHTVGAVFSVMRAIAETVAMIPLHVYERTRKGRRLARELPIYRQLHTQPNSWQTSYEWREQAVYHVGLWGSAFSELAPAEIRPYHPSRMETKRLENGKLQYRYQSENGAWEPISAGKVMQIRGPSDDGVNGWRIPEECADAILLARACEIHGKRFFTAGARPGYVLTTDGPLNGEARTSLAAQWNRKHQGVENSHETAILTNGLKPAGIPQISNTEAQFLEAREYQLREIARLYRCPGYILNLDPPTRDAEIAFIKYCIMPWLARFESAFTRSLIEDDERYYVEFDLRGLMRADDSTRSAYYRAMWDIGVLSTNSICELENLDPVEGGDVRYRPLNMGTLGEQPSVADVLAQQQPGSKIDGQGVEGGVAAASGADAAAAAPDAEPQVADVSLNGAQITGLIAIIAQIPAGLLTKEGAAALIAASFPSINAAQVQAILAGVSESATPASPAPPPAFGRSLPEQRAMTISIDFDRTFAADPALWGEFARKSVADGNTVVMISRRPEEDRATVMETLGEYADAFSQVLLVGGDTLKADAAEAAGIKVDVWVDDAPQTITGNTDGEV